MKKLYFADLTHTAQGIGAPTFPLGVSFIASFAIQELGTDDFAFRLFKFPAQLEEALRTHPPDMLCLSNYSWNFELAYQLGSLAKRHFPKLILVVGGPNFPIEPQEKLAFLGKREAIDFYIELEGELGFVELAKKLGDHQFNAEGLKKKRELIGNCSYLWQGRLFSGPASRIDDINVVPSPYLTGLLDPFFDLPLVPMVETTRGCPFTCAFCADGIAIKSRVKRYDTARTKEELNYIAQHVKNSEEIIVTDLNFGMYNEDTTTCRYIAEIQEKYHWPVLVKASAGKNRTEKVIEAASILKGTWMIGAAIQSTDPEVLKAIKRSNISSETFEKFIEFGNSLSKDATTYSEIILAMPGDTKEKHFTSLRFGVDNRVNSMRMYQAMLLVGTEMASPKCRQDYGLMTRFRTIPGCVGMYHFFGEDHPVAEIEEIIVGNNTMSLEDYLDCRVMDLFVETFYNNALFEEVFTLLRMMGISAFDFLLHMKDRRELYTSRVQQIIEEFIYQTGKDLYPTREDAEHVVLTPEVIGRYVGGELGINELLVHKALLYIEMEDISALLFTAAKEILKQRDLFTPPVEEYLAQLRRFVIHRKRAIDQTQWVLMDRYTYDFNAIGNLRYEIDPNTFPTTEPTEYTFFHDEDQKKHIAKQLALYQGTPIGLGRLIQRSNLKMMYRRFQCTVVPTEARRAEMTIGIVMTQAQQRQRFILEVRHKVFRLLELLALALSLLLAFLLRAVLKTLKPWVHIRFVRWTSQSLGIWAVPTEIYLCQRDAGMHPKRSLDLFYRYDRAAFQLKRSVVKGTAVCNKPLDAMFRRHIHLWEGARFLDYLNRLLSRGSEEFIPAMPPNYDRDGFLGRFPAHLDFTQEEEEQGQAGLRRMGVPPGAPFVCFHARDSAYYTRWRPGLELFYYGDRYWLDERDASIQNCLPAAERLTELGYFCIRMGKYVAEPLESDNPRIIDYATQYQSDFMDVYLAAHCAFFIGTNSGMTDLPAIFRRPIVFTNVAPFYAIIHAGYADSIFIPKKYYAERLGRYLTFQEIFSREILYHFCPRKHADLPEIREELHMELHENTPEEITESALEMHKRLSGTFRPREEDEPLRRRFLEILRIASESGTLPRVHDLHSLRIGSHFLKSHEELLEQKDRECLELSV